MNWVCYMGQAWACRLFLAFHRAIFCSSVKGGLMRFLFSGRHIPAIEAGLSDHVGTRVEMIALLN